MGARPGEGWGRSAGDARNAKMWVHLGA